MFIVHCKKFLSTFICNYISVLKKCIPEIPRRFNCYHLLYFSHKDVFAIKILIKTLVISK